ncbi:MAG: hypothetical protein DRH04_10005, partial [Deltaproteobacteria bacterium]
MRRKAFKVLASFLVFVVSYALFLAVWVKVRTYYGHPMNFLAAQLAAFSLNIDVEAVKKSAASKEKITMTKPIATTRGLADLVVDQTVDINNPTTTFCSTGHLFDFPFSMRLIGKVIPVLNPSHHFQRFI